MLTLDAQLLALFRNRVDELSGGQVSGGQVVERVTERRARALEMIG